MGLREDFEKKYGINTTGRGATQSDREKIQAKTEAGGRSNTKNELRENFEAMYGINTTGRGSTRADKEAARNRMQFAQEFAQTHKKSQPFTIKSTVTKNEPKIETTRFSYSSEPDYQEMVEKGKKDTRTFLGKTGILTMNPWRKYVDYMTPEQMNDYYYLEGKYGEGYGKGTEVIDYIKAITPDLDKQYADAKINEARERGEKTPVRGAVQNVWENLRAAGGYPAAVMDLMIGREVDPNRGDYVYSRIAQASAEGIREGMQERFGDNIVVNTLTDAGLASLQSLSRLPFGRYGIALAGGSAATDAMLDAKERGASDGRAFVAGTAAGAAEAMFEGLSLGNLKAFRNTPIRGVKDFSRNLGKQMIVEGSEEMGTELTNAITDKIIMGDSSNYDLAYQNYRESGMSEEEARKNVLLDIAHNVGMAGLVGGISGGLMGSGAGGLNLMGRTRNGARNQYNYQEIADAVSDNREDFLTEGTYQKGENLRELAGEYAGRQEQGEEISNYDRGYFGEVLDDYIKSNLEDVQRADNREAMRQWAMDWKDAITNRIPGKSVQGENGQALEKAGKTDNYTDVEGLTSGRTNEGISTGNPVEIVEKRQTDRGISGRNTRVSLNPTHIQEIEENSRPFGERGKAAYVDNYDGSVPLDDYHRAFGRYYDAGRYNTPMEIADQAALTSLITSDQAIAAYKAGMQDRNVVGQIRYAQGESRTGGLTQAVESATEQQKAVAENFGKKTGLNFVLTEDDMVYGGYDNQSGTIYVSVNSDNFLGTVSHELTHFIQDYDADLYRTYTDTAVKALMKARSVSYDDLIRQYMRQYEEMGQKMSREEIVDEIVADATGSFLNDEEFINQIAKDSERKAIGYKILDFINDMIDAIKSLINKNGIRRSAKGLQENLETLEIAREIWVNALNDAGERYKSGQTIQRSTEEKYQLNEFGFEEYTETQKKNWEESNIVLANTKQDILDFFNSYIQNRGPYKKLYLGEIGENLGKKILEETGVQVTGYNVCIDSYFENSHADERKESLRGQVAVTPEMISDLPEIIGNSDNIRLGKETRMGKPSLIFEKNMDGKRVAVEYVSDKRRQLTTQTMWAHKNKNLAPTSDATSASETTSETARGTALTGNVTQNEGEVKTQLEGEERKNIRFQMREVEQADVDGIIQENEQLRQMNEYLTQQLTLTKAYQPRKDDISRVAGKLLKEYGSTYNRKTLEGNLSRLYEYIRSSEQIDGTEVSKAAADIAKAILNKSEKKDTALHDQYKDVLDQLRTTRIVVPQADRADLSSEGGYQEFRRKNFGKIRFANEGIQIDSLYQELSGQYPELFPDIITNPADQAIQLADVVNELQPRVENPYQANMDEMAYILGQQIFDSYFDVRNLPPTKADRMAAEADRVRREYSRKMDQYKRDLNMKYNEALSQIRKENYEQIQNLKRRAEEARGSQKEYYQQRIRDLRDTKNQALAAQQRRYQESISSRREQREASNYRRQITKEVLQLKSWLLSPTDKKYIPDAMRGTVAEFLESIDFSSNRLNKYGQPTFQTNLWNDVKDIYAKIALQEGNLESGQGSVYMDVDPDMVAKLDSLTRKVRNIDRLADMSSNDLRDLKDVVLSMKKSVQDVNRLIANKAFQRVEEAAQGFMGQSADRRSKIERTGARQRLDDMLRNGMLDARTYFSRLGPAATTMYDSLRTGLDTKIRNTKMAQDYMQDLLKQQKVTQKELRRWSGRTAAARTFKVSGGEIKLTPAQVMSLYVLNKRSQARGHIYNKNGGIKQAPEVQMKKNKIGIASAYISRTYKPVSVTPMDVEAITDTLTRQQKDIADGIVKFFTMQTSEWGNEVTMRMYGYKKFNAPNYFPIVSDRNYIATRDGQAVNDISTLKNMGATKATVPHANNPIIIEDIFDVYTRQADQMGSYNAFVIPLSDLQKFYNYKAWEGGSVKEELQRVFGTAGQNYIHQLMVDINGSARQDKDISDIWMSNMKAASVGANLRVVIQQPTAYVRAAAEINPKYLAEGLATAPTEKNWEKVKKYAPIAQWKDWGYFSVDTGKSMKNIFLGPENLIDHVKDISMAGAGKADSLAWTWLWGAVEAETKSRNKDLKPGSEEYYQHVGKRFSEIVDKTQVVDSVLHRTRIMKSKNSLTRMATSFMSEPMKSYDMLYEAIADAAIQKNGKARQKVVRVGTSWILSGLATALAAAVIDAFRDKEEDKENKLRDRTYGEKYMAAVGSNMLDNINPLQFVPYMKELTSIISGYDPQRTELSWAVDLTQAGRNWYNYIQGDSPYTIPYLVSDSAKALSKLTGIPVENFLRVVENGGSAIISMFGAEDLKYQSKRLNKDIQSEKNTAEYVTLMMKELLKGNQRLANQIYEDMIDAGIDVSKVEEDMKELLKTDERIIEAAEKRMESDLNGYEDIVEDLVSSGYPEDLVMSAVDSVITGKEKDQQEEKRMEEVEVETEEEEKEQEVVSRYGTKDLIYAIEAGNQKSFDKVAKEIYESQIKKGKTSSKARGTIKSAITKKYKPIYIEAKSNADKLEVLSKIKHLKVNGVTLYNKEDFDAWFEESKEKKK